MVAVGLAIRVFVVLLLFRDQLDPRFDHWEFGWEMGRVAKSIHDGHGFSSPLFVPTGPTAWMTPVYPYIIAGVLKVFGLFTPASAIAILTINSVFAALTSIPVYFIARRMYDVGVAKVAGWVWALFPYSIYLSIGTIWENTLTALLGSTVFLQTLRLESGRRTRDWVLWALLWGLIAMTSPALLSVLPFLGLWLVYRNWKQGRNVIPRAAVAAVVFLACLAPWTVRNYQAFGKFIPLRDNFWLEVHVGYSPDVSDVFPDSTHPSTDSRELRQFITLGELRFMEEKKREALQFISENPGTAAVRTVRHIVYLWTGYWSADEDFIVREPMHIPNVMFTMWMTAMLVLGLWFSKQGYRRRGPMTPFVIMVAVFPIIYYITHPSMNYRHPIDPMIAILGSFAAVIMYERRRVLFGKPVARPAVPRLVPAFVEEESGVDAD